MTIKQILKDIAEKACLQTTPEFEKWEQSQKEDTNE